MLFYLALLVFIIYEFKNLSLLGIVDFVAVIALELSFMTMYVI